MKDQILSAALPQREAAKQFIARFDVSEWNQALHAQFIIWTGIQLGCLDVDSPSGKAFAKMLLANGMAGNASQFGQNLAKPADKHDLGGLLASRAKASATGLEAMLQSLKSEASHE